MVENKRKHDLLRRLVEQVSLLEAQLLESDIKITEKRLIDEKREGFFVSTKKDSFIIKLVQFFG